MFLSHMTLTPTALQSRSVQAALTRGAYGYHQLLCGVFKPAREDPFRFRHLDDERGVHFFTLSREAPDAENDGFWLATSKPFHPVLSVGQRLVFSVRINPTVNRSGGPRDPNGRRLPRKRRDLVFEAVRSHRERTGKTPDRRVVAQSVGEAWLDERLRRAGFRIDRCEREGEGTSLDVACTGYRQNRTRKRGHEITVSTLDCQGVGTLEDPEAFQALLRNGLGPAKGFGCGLLLVRRA